MENTEANCEMIWKIWKKRQLNSEMIWKTKKRKVSRIAIRYGKYRSKL
jgi:hypothetical protein